MNSLFPWLEQPLARRVGWMLLHSLWQGAVIGGLFELARFALRRRSANARYLAGCLALVFLLTASVVTLVVQSPLEIPVRSAAHSVAPAPTAAYVAHGILDGGMSEPPSSFLQASTRFFGGLAPWLTPVWLLGVAFFSFKLTQGWWWVGKIRKLEYAPVDPAWLDRLNELRRRLGVSRPVRLMQSALVEVPSVIGWLRPVILLPAASLSGLTPGQIEAILAHELAHVRRFDYVVNAFQCVVETLMFYHPIVWWISRNVREERENCCDDLVVRVCGDRVAYARALATLEEFRADLPAMAFAANGGSLVNRIRRLLGASPESPCTARHFAGLTLLGIGLALIVMGVLLNLNAPAFQATTVIRIDPSNSEVERSNGTQDSELASGYDPNFIATELAVIQSEIILSNVVQSLNLDQAWGDKYSGGRRLKTSEAARLLKSRLDLHPVSNANLVQIRITSDDPQAAAKLANAVAASYREYRLHLVTELTVRGLNALEQKWNEYQTNLTAAYAEVDRLRTQLGISDPNPMDTAASPILTPEILRQLNGQLIPLRAEQVKMETQLAELKTLTPAQRRDAIQTATGSDGQLDSLLTELNLQEKNLLVVDKDYGTLNPIYLTALGSVSNLEARVAARVEGILSDLQTKIAAGKASIAALEQQIARDLATVQKSRPYFEAKQRLEQLLAFSTILGNKIAAHRTDAILPRTSAVQVIEEAMVPDRPVSASRPRAFALIGLGSLLSVIGLAILRGGPRIEPLLHPA